MMALRRKPTAGISSDETPNVYSLCLVVKETQITAMRGHFFHLLD